MTAVKPDTPQAADGDGARGSLDQTRPVLLPFDPADLLALRVNRSQFATMCGVSRQSVSEWVRKGWITLDAGGLLDPVAAARQLLRRADPARTRARLFREAAETMGELRDRCRALRAELAEERTRGDQREAAAKFRAEDEAAARLQRFIDALLERFPEGCRAFAAGPQALETWMEELEAVAYYGADLDEFRAGMGEIGNCGDRPGICPG